MKERCIPSLFFAKIANNMDHNREIEADEVRGETVVSPPEDLAKVEHSASQPSAVDARANTDRSGQKLSEELLDAPLVHGGLWKAIWLMSWPLLISTVATSIVGAIDVQVSGYLGKEAQAAVGIAEHVLFLFMVFIFSVSVGTTAIVSREFGEGNLAGTIDGASQSIQLSVSSGFVLALAALCFAHVLLPFLSKDPEIIQLGSTYLSIFSLYMVPFSLICIINSAFRAIGDSKTPLFIVLFEVIANIFGDYAVVLWNWPVPGLGLRGIAGAAVVSAFIAAVVSLVMIRRSPLREALTLNRLGKFDWSWQKRILKIGLPSAIQRLGWAGSVFAVFFILAQLKESTAALASWTIGMRIEALLFMPLMAFSLAVSSIVGQNLGAGKPERAIKAGWNVTLIGVISMFILAAGMYLLADPIAHSMSQDAKTISFAADYMRINAMGEPFLAVAMVLMGAMQGAGDTKIPMWISLFCNWVVRLPLAWWLALNCKLETNGVWYAMISSVLACAILCTVRYQSKQWLKVKI